MTQIKPEFSYIVDVMHIAPKGEAVEISANQEQCAALAARLGVNKLDSFAIKAVVKPLNKHQYRVTGTVKGNVEQNCVVSLEPFSTEVSENFSVLFEDEKIELNVNEIDLDMSEDEDIEVLENNKIDVGEVAFEYFSLAIDPFPHAPNVEFSDKIEPEEVSNPFSVLEKFKK